MPKERLQHSHAFALVDVGFAGPLYPRINFDGKNIFICIFTCAASWIVHLELTNSLQIDKFL